MIKKAKKAKKPAKAAQSTMASGRGPLPEDRKIGELIRTRRLEIGMSQERLADIIGVTFQQVQKYEKGINRIALSRFFAISTAIELPFERVMEAVSIVAMSENDGEGAPSPTTSQEMQLIILFRKANEKVRPKIIALIRSLVEENGHD